MKKNSSWFIVASFTLVAMLGASLALSGNAKALHTAPELNREAIPTATAISTPIAPDFSDRTTTVTLADLGNSRDETLQGVTVTRSYGMHWPNSWAVTSGNAVTIVFSHAPSLAGYSSMGVDFNGVRIGSVLLTPDNTDHGSARFAIPNNAIRVGGYNTLSLQFYMGIHDNYCDDLENPGVWATIHSETFFDLSYRPATPNPDLSLYPFPLLDKSEVLVNRVTIITPDKPSIAELNAVAVISAKLGQLNANYGLILSVVSESRVLTNPAFGNVIYVGQADRLRVLTAETLPFVKKDSQSVTFISLDKVALDADDGILWEDVSPIDPTAVRLIVTGQNERALAKASRGLVNDGVYPRLAGQLGIIKNIPYPTAVSGTIKAKSSFDEMGYPDKTSRGTVRQTITYAIALSREWQVYTEASLHLHFAHSALLYPQGSTLSVSVNDTPVGSVLLTAENAEDGRASFRIPARLFEIGLNTITIDTDSQLPYDPQDQYYCNKDHYTEAWITVYADSTLNLPGGPTSLALDLRDYPFGFTGRPDLSDLAFVVPDVTSSETAQSIAWIAPGLGRYAQGQELSPQVITASEFSNAASSIYSLILIGTPSKNRAIYQLNAVLPLPFADGQDSPQGTEMIAQLVPSTGTDSVGYIEATLTDTNKPRLVVTGNSPEGVLWAAKALNDQELLSQLEDNLAVIQSPTLIYTTSINPRVAADIPVVPTPTTSSDSLVPAATTTWVMWLAVGLFLLTVLILIISIGSTLFRRRQ